MSCKTAQTNRYTSIVSWKDNLWGGTSTLVKTQVKFTLRGRDVVVKITISTKSSKL